MKKYIFFITLLASFFSFSKPAEAKVVIQEKGIAIISSEEVIDDDLFIGAENIDMTGTVTGSVFAGAGTADIKGNIKGDLILGTGTGNISGAIDGDLYVGGGDINITNASIEGNVVVGSGNLTIDKSSKIGGSLIVGSGNVKNYATVGRNVMIGAGNVYLDAKVGKEARLAGSSIQLGPNTHIAKDLTYALEDVESTLIQDESATIAGSLTRYTPPVNAKAREDMSRFGEVAGKGMLIISFLGLLVVGLLALRVLPKTSEGLSKQVMEKLGKSMGIGFLIMIASIPVFLILALTIIGLPLAWLLILVLWICLTLAKLVSSYALGHFVAKQFNWSKMGIYGVFTVGLVIFYILRAIPGVGMIISMLFTWVGLGAIWLYGGSHLKNL